MAISRTKDKRAEHRPMYYKVLACACFFKYHILAVTGAHCFSSWESATDVFLLVVLYVVISGSSNCKCGICRVRVSCDVQGDANARGRSGTIQQQYSRTAMTHFQRPCSVVFCIESGGVHVHASHHVWVYLRSFLLDTWLVERGGARPDD